MPASPTPLPARAVRRDGWTPSRRQDFLAALAAGCDVCRASARVGLSREGAYRLRRRDPEFAQAWRKARQDARQAADEAFLAMLPDHLRRTMSELSAKCELRGAGHPALDPVTIVNRV
jgi:hypothetical protein